MWVTIRASRDAAGKPDSFGIVLERRHDLGGGIHVKRVEDNSVNRSIVYHGDEFVTIGGRYATAAPRLSVSLSPSLSLPQCAVCGRYVRGDYHAVVDSLRTHKEFPVKGPCPRAHMYACL